MYYWVYPLRKLPLIGNMEFFSIRGFRFLAGWKNFTVHAKDLPRQYRYTFTVTVIPFKKLQGVRIK